MSLGELAGSAGGDPNQGADEAGVAAKRRRRSEDRDVAEAAVAANGGGEGTVDADAAKGALPVNGHSSKEADGSIAPEAVFWSALEDSKDEVSECTAMMPCRSCNLH